METVILKPLHHRGQECIGIYFEKDAILQKAIQKDAGAKWSKSNVCWYVQCTGENYILLKTALENKARLETDELKKFLLEKRKNNPSKHSSFQKKSTSETGIKRNPPNPSRASVESKLTHTLSKENRHALQEFDRHLALKAYSQSTIRTYDNEFRQFLQTIKDVPALEFSVSRLKDYFEYCFSKLHLSENTLHSRINALKFYYEQVLGREKFFWEIPRPKKPHQLPKVLSENEIGKMFNAIVNIKHKAILFTAYSAGLRVSEVINLKIKDVDSDRMQLFIERAKGKKDRYVGLGILLFDVLRAYLKSCHPMPLKYVFENPQKPGEPYSIRSAQQIFYDAKAKARINKEVGIHSLRHSFATHLLEKGIDIRYIKDLLGHLSIKTTEKYLHVKKETLINIPNVLDELNKNITLDW
ncbi:MAG: tyrosine-type recombinase/integrase [Ginsengibacter sp.]